MSDQPAPPDDDLRETVDLMGRLVARISDRVDTQTKVLQQLDGTLAEARAAAFTAAEQTDPEQYGQLVGATIDGRIADSLKRLNKAAETLLSGAERSNASFQETTSAHSSTLRLIDDLRLKQDQDKSWSRWVGLGGIILAIVLTVAVPRFLASFEEGCVVLGGTWTQTTRGVDVCVFSSE